MSDESIRTEAAAHALGDAPYRPPSPLKHRRHRRRVQQELRRAVQAANLDQEEELELDPRRKERAGPYDLRMPPEEER